MAATLVLHNARVITMDAARPPAEAVSVEGDRILAVGSDAEIRRYVGPGTEVVDCRGRAVLPGFIDAHCHVLAYAASLLSLDCSPAAVSSVADIQAALRRQAEAIPGGNWIRAVGYSEVDLAEGRHPTRWELDAAAPDHPVRLIHRSGHACVLNSLALRLCGIGSETEEPGGGCLERDLSTGEPTGLLLEMNELVERAVPPLSYEQLAQAVGLASGRFLAAGVTSVVDATHSNGPAEWELLRRLRQEGHLAPRLTAMVGFEHREEASGWEKDSFLELGALKIAIKELGGGIYPEEDALGEMVMEAQAQGWQVAIHAVEERAVAAAASALAGAVAQLPRQDHRHRIEHCGLCPPAVAARIGAAGLVVVSQPAFLYHNGERYLRQVAPQKQGYLYPLRSLQRAGVRLAAGSDCPVVPPDVIPGLYGAVGRRSQGGRLLPGEEALSIGEALAMYTSAAAYASFAEGERGSIAPAKVADLVVLSGDPTTCPPDELLGLRPEMTIIGGQVVWAVGR
ncbi:MAG: amidohydrolase [Chloroflexota bacterium]|nr:amidohydrolase [Chloroflexota bacterium]